MRKLNISNQRMKRLNSLNEELNLAKIQNEDNDEFKKEKTRKKFCWKRLKNLLNAMMLRCSVKPEKQSQEEES